MATGEWRPNRFVVFLIVSVLASIVILLIGLIIVPELASVINLEKLPDSYYENRIKEMPSTFLFAAGGATVVAVIRMFLK